MVELSEVLILHLNHEDECLWHKVMDLLEENGYKIDHLHGNKKILQYSTPYNGRICFDGLHIDRYKRIVIRAEREIELTYTEFEILLLLAQNIGTVFSKEQIYDSVWKEPYLGDNNIVMSHIRNLREKIEDNPSKPIYIQTVWGVGYRFNKNISRGL